MSPSSTAERLHVIRTVKELEALKAYLKDKEYVAVDTETTGLAKGSEIIGYSVCADVNEAWYVIIAEWSVEQKKLLYLETKAATKDFFNCLVGKALVFHNAIFDCAMIHDNFQVDMMPSVHTDTMIAAHLLNENRRCGLKDLAVGIFGEDSKQEFFEMRASIVKNGGQCTKEHYDLYKADSEIIGRYGAKDTILTLKLFYHFVPELYEQKLDKFFWEEESMPLLRGPTYQLNTTGLRVDPDKLQQLRASLEAEIAETKAFIYGEIKQHIEERYPGTRKNNTFNLASRDHLAWLLFEKLGEEFRVLNDVGKQVCKHLGMKPPYFPGAKKDFIRLCTENKGTVWAKEGSFNPNTMKARRKDERIGDPWTYMSTDRVSLQLYADKYKWVERLLAMKKADKLLSTYAIGIQERAKYNIIRPSFLQHGTTSGRYSSRDPNFQNLPRDDKRVKSCIVARPGKVFVGADQSQLEPRVFASIAQDETLMECFKSGKDFYSVVGAPIYDKTNCSLFKEDKDSFAKKYPHLRDKSKVIALATPYGRTAFQQAATMGISKEEAQDLIDRYFAKYPKVELMMLESHEMAKRDGVVYNLFGRPRRIPEAKKITKIYGNLPHAELPYIARTYLNLSMNHRVQSTAASVMNRVAIAFYEKCQELAEYEDPAWREVKIILQVHDEIVAEGPEHLGEKIAAVLKDAMENTVQLPGVALVTEPKIGKSLADLK